MPEVIVIAEGRAEEDFVRGILAPHLAPRRIYAKATRLGKGEHQGGRVEWQRLRKHVRNLLRQRNDWYVTTLYDFFGMDTDMPGSPFDPSLSVERKKEIHEAQVLLGLADLGLDEAVLHRFLPYVQMHEFEGLLFSDPLAMGAVLEGVHPTPGLGSILLAAREQFPSPEHINTRPSHAPSKVIGAHFPAYDHRVDAFNIAEQVGLNTMRKECPLFNTWVGRLESLVEIGGP